MRGIIESFVLRWTRLSARKRESTCDGLPKVVLSKLLKL